jgi:fused signal recognition particle receptor
VKLRTKLFKALSRTRSSLAEPLKALNNKKIDDDLLMQLEESLITSDVGIKTTDQLIDKLSSAKSDDALKLIEDILLEHLPNHDSIQEIPNKSVILLMGVNGTGKTTTTAKLANYLINNGHTIFMVGADTYRAAAAAQLEEWAKQMNAKIVCNAQSNDPSAVLFDGMKSATKNNSDVVIVDTAGRLHTYKNLMAELGKMIRLVDRHYSQYNIISLLTIDASLGQNSLIQAREFTKLFKVDGVILTKMDGTARGGIAFPLYEELKIPVLFIGVGEKLDDLIPFNPKEYVKSIMDINEDDS